MEIKIRTSEIIQGLDNDHNVETFLFEGNDIHYQWKLFTNSSKFVEMYNNIGVSFIDCQIGIPTWLWDEESDKSGHFLVLSYRSGEDEKQIVVMNAKIFITNHGQTVDIITV
jgi:hypothetical protein